MAKKKVKRHVPKGYYGWDMLDGERGAITLKDALHNLDARENGDDHEYSRGVLVGVVSTLMATGMEFDKAIQLVWQLAPGKIPKERVPESWQIHFADRWRKRDEESQPSS